MRRQLNHRKLLTTNQFFQSSEGSSEILTPVLETQTSAATAENIRELLVPAPPGLTSGDLWIIVFAADNVENVLTPSVFGSSFSRGAETDNSSAEQPTAVVFYKVSDGTEVDVLIEWGSIEQAVAKSIRISGGTYDTSTVANSSVVTGSLNSPNLTIAEDNSLIIQVGIGDDNNGGTIFFDNKPAGTAIGSTVRSAVTGGVLMDATYNIQNSGPAAIGNWIYGEAATRSTTTFTIAISPF